jgi:hypothetical protein
LLVFVLPAINLLAIGGLAALGVLVARRQGMNPWWGVLLPLALNVAMPALRNLTDVVSTLTVCGLLVAWLHRARWWCLGWCAAASLLAREQNLTVVGFVGMAALWHGRIRVCAALAAATALWGAWVAVVWHLYGASPFALASQHFGLPLMGMAERLVRLGEWKLSTAAYHLANLTVILSQAALAFYLVARGRRSAEGRPDPALALAALTGAGMALSGTFIFYTDYWACTRVFVLLPLGGWLLCVQLRWRSALAALGSIGVLPLAFVCKLMLNHL